METDLKAAELAEIERQLDGLCERLEARLRGHEAYRALGQLTAREAQGRPIEAMATGELRAHLERELNADPFFRLLTKLRDAQFALKPQVSAPMAVPEPAKAAAPAVPAVEVTAPKLNGAEASAVVVEPERPAAKPAQPALASQGSTWDAGNLQAAALAAVASAFGTTAKTPSPDVPAKPADPVPLPAVDPGPATEARARSAERIWLPLAAPRSVLFGQTAAPEHPPVEASKTAAAPPVAEPVAANIEPVAIVVDDTRTRQPRIGLGDTTAESTVLATLAKLRSPATVPTPAVVPDLPLAPLAIEAGRRLDPHAGPRTPRLSMEGTMANVAAAVAATVAAAERISGPQSTWTARPAVVTLPPPGSPAARISIPDRPAESVVPATHIVRAPASGTLFRDRSREAPAPPVSDEGMEIRFVSRPASPMLDAVPRQVPKPLADVPMPSAIPSRNGSLAQGGPLPPDWEEASVEIRRAPEVLAAATPNGDRAPVAERASAVLSRFVKVLKRDRPMS